MNKLVHLKEFEDILSRYKISEHAESVLEHMRLIMMVSPSSTGRNTVIREMQKTGNYHFIISDTTRKPRINDGVPETDGVEYWFKSEQQMLESLREGEMLEAEIIHGQQVSGISIQELENAQNENSVAVTDMDIGGVEAVIRHKPDAIALFLLPPSFEEWQRRLKHRGEMHPEEFRRRLSTAVKILRKGLELTYSVFVVHDEFHETARIINEIFHTLPDQIQPREVAKKLLESTEAYLLAN